jgi:biotin carboxyl carrier protein
MTAAAVKLRARIGADPHEIDVARRADGTLAASVDGRAYSLSLREPQPLVYSILSADGASHEAIIQQRPGAIRVSVDGVGFDVIPEEGAGAGAAARDRRGAGPGQARITAIMPGRIVRLLVKPGDQVSARQGLLVVEAMKMENEITAPRAGTIKQVFVAAGRPVEAGEALLVLE